MRNTFSDNQLGPLDLSVPPQTNRFIETYTTFYSLNFQNVSHHIGNVNLSGYNILAQLFTPVTSSGTVIIVHGYFDHGAMMRNCIDTCLQSGFSAAVLDLPGHGLSSGKRASIGSFSEYALILDEFTEIINKHVNHPIHFIGHSTGCAAALEWMYTPSLVNSTLLNKVIFLAPLVRSAGQKASQFLYSLLKNGITEIRPFYHPTTSNPEFEEFRKNDPLRPRKFPLSWLGAEIKWNLQMQKRGLLEREIFVLQGNQDRIVDWKYNLQFLMKKMRSTKIVMVDNARHQLHNEKLKLRSQVLEQMQKNLLENINH